MLKNRCYPNVPAEFGHIFLSVHVQLSHTGHRVQNPKQGAHGAVNTRIPTQTSTSKPATNTVFRMASCRLRAKAIIFFMTLIISIIHFAIGHKKGTSSRPCLHRLFLTTLSCRRRGRRQLRHFDDTAALTNEHTIYSDEVAPAKTANCYTLHTGFAQSFQHGFGSFEMFEAAVTLGSGIVIYVYHIFTALVFLGISKPAGYTSGIRNFPEVLCVHSRNSGINTARICA